MLGRSLLPLLLAYSLSADADDLWVAPAERFALTASLVEDNPRPLDTPLHPSALAGSIALSCEHIEGRPCGTVAFAEVDSRAGYSDLVSIATRLRTSSDDAFTIDRAHIDLGYGFVAAKVGRDVVHLGPSARTTLSWGDHPAPLDQARMDITIPHASGVYLVGRAREPQRFPGTLVSVGRGQLDIEPVSLGIVHMMQVNGDGAQQLGVIDFVLEHVRRKDLTASDTDSSNRRFGSDISLSILELQARLYYILVFEDIRKARVIDALRYDADHLVGVQTPCASVEYHVTAARSQEHSPRTTGFTNRGYVVGSPLGPDARSLYVAGRVGNFTPWMELVRLRNRTLEYVVDGPINVKTEGQDEGRYRIGVRATFPLPRYLTLEVEAMYERVDDFAFEPHDGRNHGGLRATLVWLPRI